MKMKYPDGREDSQLPDGTKLWTDGKGHGVMTFLSGIREIYTPICKVSDLTELLSYFIKIIIMGNSERGENIQMVQSKLFTRMAVQKQDMQTEEFVLRIVRVTLLPTQVKYRFRNETTS